MHDTTTSTMNTGSGAGFFSVVVSPAPLPTITEGSKTMTTEEKIDWNKRYAAEAVLAANYASTFQFSRRFGVDAPEEHRAIAFSNMGWCTANKWVLEEFLRRVGPAAVEGFGWSDDEDGPYTWAVVLNAFRIDADDVDDILSDCWKQAHASDLPMNDNPAADTPVNLDAARPLLTLADAAKIGGAK